MRKFVVVFLAFLLVVGIGFSNSVYAEGSDRERVEKVLDELEDIMDQTISIGKQHRNILSETVDLYEEYGERIEVDNKRVDDLRSEIYMLTVAIGTAELIKATMVESRDGVIERLLQDEFIENNLRKIENDLAFSKDELKKFTEGDLEKAEEKLNSLKEQIKSLE